MHPPIRVQIFQALEPVINLIKPHLLDLNPPQQEAVQHHLGPLLILAGAGSGKTRVLTRRIAALVTDYGERPDSILAVTFTNKATQEMRERVAGLLGDQARAVWVATFHSAGLRILRRHATLLDYTHDFVVYDDQDSTGLMKQLLTQENIDPKKYAPSFFLRAFDQYKNSLIDPALALKQAETPTEKLKADVYKKFQAALKGSNAMDFGDLLMNAVTLLRDNLTIRHSYQHMLKFVLVDEFQDTNIVQYEFVKLLTQTRRNLLVVGDDDQSIYAFRGATIRNILDFEKDFPDAKVIKLEQNYRSTGNILNAAHSVIEENKDRKDKKLWTEAANGPEIITFVADDETQEADFISNEIAKRVAEGAAFKDCAIFYRTNAQSRAIEEQLISRRIPYRIYGGLKFYERKEIKDVLAYLRLIANPSDSQAFMRIVNNPPRGIGQTTIASIVDLSYENGISCLDASRALAEKNKNIAKFLVLIDQLVKDSTRIPLSELIAEVILRINYTERIKSVDESTSDARIENLKELQAIGASMEGGDYGNPEENMTALRAFLDRVSLTSGIELPDQEIHDEDQTANTVSLMTLHLAKGLEFPYVFLTGCEEGLLPHYRSIEDGGGAIEEERRLCYVGITRAMNVLYMTRSMRRGMFSSGNSFGMSGMYREPSRFLYRIPNDIFQHSSTDIKSFFNTQDVYDDDDYDVPFSSSDIPRESTYQSSPRTSRGGIVLPFPKLRSADDLHSQLKTEEETGLLAKPEELAEGVRVKHPSFGLGTVKSFEGDINTLESLRILIQFDQDGERAKRLVYRYARLSLAE